MSTRIYETLASALRSLFDAEVSVSSLAMVPREPSPFEEEETLINGLNPIRQYEFRAGRLCARKALRNLGIPEMPILSEENRGPAWPKGVVGSISHTREHCIAAVALEEKVKSLGLDMEQWGRLKPELWRLVLTKKEMLWIDSLSEEDRIPMAALIFSAKEAFYKYQFPLTRMWLGFQDACVTVLKDEAAFTLSLLKDVPVFNAHPDFKGRFAFSEGYVLTGIA